LPSVGLRVPAKLAGLSGRQQFGGGLGAEDDLDDA
jgi:hypothetical protein